MTATVAALPSVMASSSSPTRMTTTATTAVTYFDTSALGKLAAHVWDKRKKESHHHSDHDNNNDTAADTVAWIWILWPGLFFDHCFYNRLLAEWDSNSSSSIFYALDPPGFGRSDPLRRDITMEECGAALLEIVQQVVGMVDQQQQQQRPRIGLIGTSWGGITALNAALQLAQQEPKEPNKDMTIDMMIDTIVCLNTPLGAGSDTGIIGWLPVLATWLPRRMFAQQAAASLLGPASQSEEVEYVQASLAAPTAASLRHAIRSVLHQRGDLYSELPKLEQRGRHMTKATTANRNDASNNNDEVITTDNTPNILFIAGQDDPIYANDVSRTQEAVQRIRMSQNDHNHDASSHIGEDAISKNQRRHLVVVKESGHSTALEQPAETYRAIASFCRFG